MVKSQISDDMSINIDQKKHLFNSNQRYLYVMHFVSAKVAAKMPSQSVLFIPSSDAHFGRGFGPFWSQRTTQIDYK
jgi:hypothetical protein